MRRLAALTLSFATGCLALIDTDHPDDGPFPLRVPVPPSARLALYQDGDGPWQPLPAGGGEIAEVEIHGQRFGHAFVCPMSNLPPGSPPSYFVPVQLRARRDAAQPDPCSAPPTVRMYIDVPNRNYFFTVHVGDVSGSPSSQPTMPVPAGIWDIAAVATNYLSTNRTVVAIQRNVDLRADGSITIDLSQQAIDLLWMPEPVIDRGGVVDDSTSYGVSVVFPSGTRAVFGSYDTSLESLPPPMLPPPGLLGADDRLFVEVAASDSDPFRARGQQRPMSGQSAGTFRLPPHADVTYGAGGVTWTGDWELVRLQLGYMSQATPPTSYTTAVELTATAGWLDDAGNGNTLPRFDPTTLPGWDPAWAPPPDWIGWSLKAWTGDRDGEMTWVETGGGGPP